MDRYNHDIGDDTDDTDDSPLFGSFSSYSPQSRKISQTRPPNLNPESETDYLKKQLFRNELERTVAQLSTSNSVPLSSKGEEKPTNAASKQIQDLALVNKIIPPVEQNRLEEKSDTPFLSPATVDSSETQVTLRNFPQTPNSSLCHSTPDSSQTESDDVSPQIQRRRHTHSRDKLPRFSISIDGENM